jgi:hypothetical protein
MLANDKGDETNNNRALERTRTHPGQQNRALEGPVHTRDKIIQLRLIITTFYNRVE